MKRQWRGIRRLGLVLVAVGIVGCGEKTFEQPVTLGEKEVSPEVLNLGKDTYTLYCRACHGVNGDGNGPAAKGLRPPPRNFHDGLYKFVAVESGYLPNDEDFHRIIRGGLKGTAMLPWDISDERLDAVIQYIKTFSERWQDEYEEVGEAIVPDDDPYGPERRAEAVETGKKLYHALAQCNSCHPSYIPYDEIYQAGVELTGYGKTDLDERIYTTQLKDSDYGNRLQPPDFTFHQVRAGEDVKSLFRTIASGIGGTAMPTWKGSLPDDQIWALAYYVRSLIDMRGTDAALELKERLRSQPPFTPPDGSGR
jgi:mono/diheme cytochrome c family protein